MGAWGAGTFDNDTAGDWAYELENAADLSLVEATLGKVSAAGSSSLDSDLACEALAACEVVARLKGHWGTRNSYTEAVDAWVETHPCTPSSTLVELALAAIDRIVQPPSELLELWDESCDGGEWRAAVADLRTRVAG